MGNSCSVCKECDKSPVKPVNGLVNGHVTNLLQEAEVIKTTVADVMLEDPSMAAELSKLVTRLEAAVQKLEGIGGPSPATAAPSAPTTAASSSPFVLAYDDLLNGPLKVFLNCSAKIGGDVAQIAKIVEGAFQIQRNLINAAAQSKQPSDSELPKVLTPLGEKIQEVITYRESHRTSPFFNHLSAISESISGLSWVAVAPAPGPYVKEMGDAAMFYTNRVLKDYREKDKTHVEWVQHWNSVFKELQAYIKEHHTTGLVWNPRGGSAISAVSSGAGAIPPPPPGAPPPPPPMVDLAPKVPVDDGRSKLFDEINQGSNITSSLKKVTDDMKTHKNPSLRSGPQPFVKSDGTPASAPAPPTRADKPPKTALQGKKWFVEYHKNVPNMILDSCQMDQSIYIFKCENTVVQIKGKINSVIMDSCKKSSVVFDNLVSACEIVNCQSCQMQVMGKVPTIAIEKTDGCQVYLSPDSLNVEIISAKSSEMNILIPKGNGDFAERAVPEQFKTTIKGTNLVTAITEKAG